MEFSEKILAARKALGISRERLASITDLTTKTLYTYESGKAKPKSIEVYNKLAESLGVSAGYLAMDEDRDVRGKPEKEIFFEEIEKRYGSDAVDEAKELLSNGLVLFEGGTLDDSAQETLERSLLSVFMSTKEKGR
ncbi:MAG: helix-turn-helix domain-containing protein [Oscillospiraceae bacterium]|nr:helix-turn-helix domain-containing protein [Oscillospiraceae bacterium]